MTDEIRAVLDDWTDAIVARDQGAADSILAPGFVLRSVGGVAAVMPRAEWLASLPSIESASLEVLDYEARVFGETAVARTRQHWQAHIGDRNLTGDYVIVDVFERNGERWQPVWRISQRLP